MTPAIPCGYLTTWMALVRVRAWLLSVDQMDHGVGRFIGP